MSVAILPAVAAPERYRLPIIWPSQLKLYLDCPERYYHKYVSRRRGIAPFSRDLARGIALHATLAECFTEFQRSRGFPINIEERVEGHLRQSDYPDELVSLRTEDAENVVAYVKWVLSEFDCTVDVLSVEETLGYYYRGANGGPACLFRAKVDLVLAHTDGTLEHVDFKGGKVKPDPIQEVLSRVVVASEYGDAYPVIRTTTHFVADHKRASAVLERAACRDTWATIKCAVSEIMSRANWKPSPSPFCGTCPYFTNGCSITLESSTTDGLSNWLDGEDA
jgi:hypothetical protein